MKKNRRFRDSEIKGIIDPLCESNIYRHHQLKLLLDCFKNLKTLNLGYNELEHVQKIFSNGLPVLECLVLAGNRLQSIDKLNVGNLVLLDLSHNNL